MDLSWERRNVCGGVIARNASGQLAFHIVIWAPQDHAVVEAERAGDLGVMADADPATYTGLRLPGISPGCQQLWKPLPIELRVLPEWARRRRRADSSENRLRKEENSLSKCIWPSTLSVQPLAPLLLNVSIFFLSSFLIGFCVRGTDRGECGLFWRGVGRSGGAVTIHIWIIWQLHLLLRSRLDSSTMAEAVAPLQHAWPSCLNNTASVLRHHTVAEYWFNARAWHLL